MRRSSRINETGRGRWRVPGARLGRPLRRATLGCVLASAVASTGCATKNDLKQLRNEVQRMQERQDSAYRELQAQYRVLMDTVRTSAELMLRVRGDLGYQLQQMGQQLIQIQELTGQSQRRLAELRQQWESRSQQFSEGAAPPAGSPPAAGGGADVEQLYSIGIQKLEEGAAATARQAFQEIVSRHPTDARAADAQFQLAETYIADEDFGNALRELQRVVELFPDSPRAPQALYRAGVISRERGNISEARGYFNRVVSGYPMSDEARMAKEALQGLSGR